MFKNPTIAILLELIPGFFFQTFGLGNIYAGNVWRGFGIMILWWIALAINLALCFVVVGFITLPLTWLLVCIMSMIAATHACAKIR